MPQGVLTGSPTTKHKQATTTTAPLLLPVTVGSAKTITGAVTAGGLVRITSVGHALVSGDRVYVAAVGGVTGALGAFTINVVDGDKFDLLGSTFGGTYTSGGTATKMAAGNQRAPSGVTVLNLSGVPAYIGGPAITADGTDATAGFPIPVGGVHWFNYDDPSNLFCKTASGTAELYLYY
jgi:hypothetical protein